MFHVKTNAPSVQKWTEGIICSKKDVTLSYLGKSGVLFFKITAGWSANRFSSSLFVWFQRIDHVDMSQFHMGDVHHDDRKENRHAAG